MSNDGLLAGFDRDEVTALAEVLARESGAVTGNIRTPTWDELWEAGWIEPPWCPWPRPIVAGLLQELRDIGPHWAEFFDDYCDALLLPLHEREPGRLRHKVTKRWGHMWRLSKRELARKENTP